VAAAGLLDTKLHDVDEAVAVLDSGWRIRARRGLAWMSRFGCEAAKGITASAARRVEEVRNQSSPSTAGCRWSNA